MAGYKYLSVGDLQNIGEKIRAKAIKVAMSQEETYGEMQQEANNDATRHATGQQTMSQNYHAPSSGAPDDDGNLRRYVTDMYQDIPMLFTSFAVPDPDASKPALDALYQVAATLQPNYSIKASGTNVSAPLQVNGANGTVPVGHTQDIIVTHMKAWHGDAAGNFENYVKFLGDAAASQQQIAVSLANGIEAMVAIRKAMLTDIGEIGDKTYKALDELDSWCSNSASQAAKLTIYGALAAVAFVATDGVAAVAVAGLAAGGDIMGANLTLQQAKSEPISGGTVPAVLSGMANALDALTKGAMEQERAVADALSKVNTVVNGHYNQLMVPPPEELYSVGGKTANDLKNSSGFFAT